MPADTPKQLQEVARAVASGDKGLARQLIADLLEKDPYNAEVWYTASSLTDDPDKQVQALERTLSIDPWHRPARDALEHIRKQSPDRLESLIDSAPRPAPPKKIKRRSLGCWSWIVAGLFMAVVVWSWLSSSPRTSVVYNPTSRPSNTPGPSPTHTLSPTPSNTPTATLSPTPSDTPTATATLSKTDIAQTLAYNASATRQQAFDNGTATGEALGATRTQQADDRTSTADAVQSTRTFISDHKPIAAGELISYADNHVGDDVVIRGRVFNIIDDQTFQMFIGGGYDAVAVKCADSISGIYKDDAVTVYGTVAGYAEGTNAFGASVKQPLLVDAVVVK